MTPLPRQIRPAPRRRAPLLAIAPLALAILALAPRPVAADQPEFGPYDVPTAFYINKSDDLNRVDYGLRLDAACQPAGGDPLFPYWREFEPPPPVRTHGLKWIERIVYGVGKQRVVRRTPSGVELTVRLKKLDREVLITTSRDASGRCTSSARARIGAIPNAILSSAFVKVAGAMSIHYVELRGVDPDSGDSITERIVP